MLKRTPLFAAHQKLGARLVEFGGWEMPLQYSSIVEEHLAVRHAAGLFDISHMGEVWARGPGAMEFLNRLLTNDLRKLEPGQGQYTLLGTERGGTIDDLYAYRVAPQEYLLILNASRIEADTAWIERQLEAWPRRHELQLDNASDRLGALALQGPRAVAFIELCIAGPSREGTPVSSVSGLKKNQIGQFEFEAQPLHAARTGYTGEDGFEIVAPSDLIERVWTRLLAVGEAHGLQPAGLGARDTLRTEMGFPLYGHELSEDVSPLEAGLGPFVAFDKPEFVGREVWLAQKASGVTRRRVAFRMAEKGALPRPHCGIWSTEPDGRRVGEVTSGTQSPCLGVGIGMGYVPPPWAAPGTPIGIEIRGRRHPAVVHARPIYQRKAAVAG